MNHCLYNSDLMLLTIDLARLRKWYSRCWRMWWSYRLCERSSS